jgi:hypothetical protein
MTRAHEWDWPPRRRRGYFRTYRTFDVPQPSGWNSPVVKKIVSIYWLVLWTCIKVLFAIPLSIALIGAIWLLWVLITLYL